MRKIWARIRVRISIVVSRFRITYFRFNGVKIGKKCFISWQAHIDIRRGILVIGNNVAIASGSYVLSHTGYRPLKDVQTTIIEDNVKIYVNSVILPGIRIGKNSIVGAGSVVMRDVPSGVIVQGNPARVIKRLAEEEIKRIVR